MNVFYKILTSILILFVLTNNTFSNTNIYSKNKQQKSDTSMILDLSNRLILWPYLITKKYNLNILNTKTRQKLLISPNEQTNIGLGFNYKWLGFGIALKTPWINNDDNIYGKTERVDLQINIFSRKFGVDFSTQYYKGYYISNPKDFLDWNKPEYPQLNDLETFSMELSTYYFFNNNNFSYRAAFVRNEIQKKSAGSAILGVYARLDATSHTNGFVPEDMPEYVQDSFNILGFLSNNLGISFGYAYTFVIKKHFFISLSLVPGLGVKTANIYTKTEDTYHPKSKASIRIISRIALGYENRKFYAGIANIGITNSFDARHINITSSTNKFRIYIGKRFNLHKK